MAKTSIEWTDRTWNPIRGCTRVSPGCGGPGPHGGCYAERMAARFSGPGKPYEGLVTVKGGKPRWTGKVTFGHDLDAPLRWRKPQRIFVNSMSDLFHEGLTREEIATVYAICIAAHLVRGHVSQILTKRSARMRAVLNDPEFWAQVNAEVDMHVLEHVDSLDRRSDDARATAEEYGPDNPPPGVWLGVSAEDQRRADERVPDLLATPAAVRWVSAEPLLEPIDFRRWLFHSYECEMTCGWRSANPPSVEVCQSCGKRSESFGEFCSCGAQDFGHICPACGNDAVTDHPNTICLDWIVVGGESGPGARPMHPDWARQIRDACEAAEVPYHHKQNGEWAHDLPWANAGSARDLARMAASGAGKWDAETDTFRVGKKAAGRFLDGKLHDALPEVRHG